MGRLVKQQVNLVGFSGNKVAIHRRLTLAKLRHIYHPTYCHILYTVRVDPVLILSVRALLCYE